MDKIELLKSKLQRMNPQMPGYTELNSEIKRLNKQVAGPLVNVGYLSKESYGGKRKTRRTKRKQHRRRTCHR